MQADLGPTGPHHGHSYLRMKTKEESKRAIHSAGLCLISLTTLPTVLILMTEQRTPTGPGGTHLLSQYWNYKGSDQEFKASIDSVVSLKPAQVIDSHDIALVE